MSPCARCKERCSGDSISPSRVCRVRRACATSQSHNSKGSKSIRENSRANGSKLAAETDRSDSQSNELCFSRSVCRSTQSVDFARYCNDHGTSRRSRRNCKAAASKLGVARAANGEGASDVLQRPQIARIIETTRSLRGMRTNPDKGWLEDRRMEGKRGSKQTV